MRSRKSFWILLSLLLLAGAWFFWHQDNQRRMQEKKSASRIIQTFHSASTAPKFLTKSTLAAKTVKIGTSVTNKFAYRLSNTSKSIGELVSDDKAILLENALIDLRNPLNFSIPKNLQAQGDPGAYIVQANGPIDNAFRAMLAAAGATIVSYIPNDAYLVRAPAGVANGIAADGFSVIPYEPYYKVQSSLLAFDEKPLPGGTVLNLGLFGDDALATIQQIEKLGGQVFAEDASPFGKIVRVIPPQNWTALVQLPGVQLVEPFRKRTLANDLARVTLGVATNTIVTTNYMNLTGKNVMVEMNDSGVDASHPDLTMARVFGDAPQSLVDTNGHGTHVAGIIAGDGTESATVTHAQGSINPGVTGQYRGKAQAAKLYSVGGVEGDDTNLISDSYLQEQPALTNALISNNSWGFDGDNTYDLAAASYDAAVRDALPGVTGSQPVLFVFAAGDDGAGDDTGGGGIADSISSPGTAKDVITVGATEQLRNITNYVTASDGSSNQFWLPMTDSSSQVASYSSRGNVGVGIEGNAGRFKPDVVTPGTFVVSTRSGQWDTNAYFTPTNISEGELSDEVDPNSANFYSVSIPSNAVQLIIQVERNSQSPDPLPNMPILVWNGTDPRVANPYFTNQNIVIIPTNTAALNPVGTVWQYAISNSTSEAVNYDLIVDVITTNDLGDYFDVLYALDESLGPYYRYESGTSMAAPAVSGVLALVQDFFTNHLSMQPSPALMKAMIINGARQTANYSFQVQNSINFQGWGMVNLPDSLPIGITTNVGTVCSSFIRDQSPATALATGDSQTFVVAVTNAQAQFQPLRVTLAWTDPPGNPAAAIKLVNNLDLVVSNMDTGSTVYYGNDISSGIYNTPENPSSPPNLDSVNNIENVYIAPLLGTNYSITVIGNRVNVNAVTAHTNNVVQDYALVISSGDGTVTNAIMVTTNAVSFVSNPTSDQQITYVTNSNAPLLNQFVGANTPLLGTNTLSFNGTAPEDLGTNWQVTVGQTNQWHFYVVTNTTGFTNAAFITFEPPTLSIPREGVFADSVDNATRPEADIDLYVSTNPALTNLDTNVISAAITNGTVSLGRGGTEYVAYTNSSINQIYYIGVKSEDQEASEYDFMPVFTQTPFSVMQNGDEIVYGLQLPVNIPDGSPARPGVAYIIGLALYPIPVGSVVVTNQIWHQNFGDLIGPLKHNDISVVLNNHDSLGNTIGDPPFVYDDSGANDIVGSRPSDGPGSLNNFRGTEGIGPWILAEVDDSLTQTGSVQQFSLQIQPHQPGDNSHTNTIASNGWFYDFVDVPPGATNLTITVTNLTIPPSELDLFVKYGALPTTNSFDEETNIISPVTVGSISINAPLTAGRYYYGVYNPSAAPQQFFVNWTVLPPLPSAPQVDFSSSGPAAILDDAIMTNSIFVSPGGIISSVDVGIAVQHPRISDLVFHLISPDGTRVLLMENRGGADTNGAGGSSSIVTNNALASDFDAATAMDYPAGQPVAGWNVTSNQVSVVADPTNAYPGKNNLLALANGTISTTLSTTPGATYTLKFAYRGPGIVGWWRGENNGGADSISGNNGTFPNGMGFAAGEVNNCFNLNGVNQYVLVNPSSPANLDLSLGSGFTVEGWIKPTALTPLSGSGMVIVEYERALGTGSGNDVGLDFSIGSAGAGSLNANIKDVGQASHTFNSAAGLVTTGVWQHVALTYNKTSGVAEMYLNGAIVAQMNLGSFTPLMNFTNILIGARTTFSPNPNSQFAGGMDEISFYNRALSTSEIKAIFTDSTAGKFDPSAAVPQNLSKASVAISVVASTNFYANNTNTNWLTTNITFTATQSSTPLQITGLEPGMLLDAPSVMSVTTNYNYLVFTENTNLTTTPIKFAVPPFVSGTTNYSIPPIPANVPVLEGPILSPVNNHYYYLLDSTNWTVSETWAEELGGHLATIRNALENNWIANTFSAYDSTNRDYWIGFYDPTQDANGLSHASNFAWVSGEPVTYTSWASGEPDNDGNVPPLEYWVYMYSLLDPRSGFGGNWNDYTNLSSVGNGLYPQNGIVEVIPQIVGSYYLPEQSLDAFTGENAEGTWLLEIQDDRAGAGLTNTLASWQLRFNFTTSTTSLTNSQTATNSLQPGGIAYYLVNVPTNADFATNFLFTTGGPLNFWFNETAPPSGTNSPGNYLLFNTSVNDSNVLSTAISPTNIVPGGSYYLAVQNTNSFAVTNFAVQVDFHLLTVTDLTNGVPQTNSVPPGGIAYYLVNVPTNADYSTNSLSMTNGPLNLLFDQATLPVGVAPPDYLLFSASTNDSTILGTNSPPPFFTPGGSYYLGVQNTNSFAVNYTIAVNFHLIPTAPITNYPISGITFTNNGILLTWYAPTNYQFVIQWTRNLSPSPISWTTVPGVTPTLVSVAGTTGTYQWFDDFSLTGGFGAQKFYRLIAYPPGVPIPPSLIISSVQAFPGGGIQLQWMGSTNYLYDILWTSNLALARSNWNVLSNQVPPTLTYTNGVFTFSDPSGALTGGAAATKFFQVLELP